MRREPWSVENNEKGKKKREKSEVQLAPRKLAMTKKKGNRTIPSRLAGLGEATTLFPSVSLAPSSPEERPLSLLKIPPNGGRAHWQSRGRCFPSNACGGLAPRAGQSGAWHFSLLHQSRASEPSCLFLSLSQCSFLSCPLSTVRPRRKERARANPTVFFYTHLFPHLPTDLALFSLLAPPVLSVGFFPHPESASPHSRAPAEKGGPCVLSKATDKHLLLDTVIHIQFTCILLVGKANYSSNDRAPSSCPIGNVLCIQRRKLQPRFFAPCARQVHRMSRLDLFMGRESVPRRTCPPASYRRDKPHTPRYQVFCTL